MGSHILMNVLDEQELRVGVIRDGKLDALIHERMGEGQHLGNIYKARVANVEQRKSNEMIGAELGYRYVDSPVIWPEAGDGPPHDFMKYVPSTWPGARLPHVWLDDSAALHDRIGEGYTLLRLAGSNADVAPLERAFARYGAPFSLLDIAGETPRAVYGNDLLLLRPDLHVVWRGNNLPDAAKLATVATGH